MRSLLHPVSASVRRVRPTLNKNHAQALVDEVRERKRRLRRVTKQHLHTLLTQEDPDEMDPFPKNACRAYTDRDMRPDGFKRSSAEDET